MNSNPMYLSNNNLENTVFTATFAGGCYWCLEPMFSKLNGISNVISGFSGGITENPTYKDVCSGKTKHAEVVHFDYNPNIINYVCLTKIFFSIHNPTTLNRQGNDIGNQYRSAIFYHDDYQKIVAQETIKYLMDKNIWKNIVTDVSPFNMFYPAEKDHQNYFHKNHDSPYCQLVINPKIKKFKELFAEKIR